MSPGPPPQDPVDGEGAFAGGTVLEQDEVHVWCASLEPPVSVLDELWSLLDDVERQRAERYTFEKGRRQSTVARGLLRRIVGRYLGIDPRAVRFRYNPHGKPELDEATGAGPLHFNLSHSGNLVLFAVARDRDVGVDLETIRPDFATEGIAERFFAPGERRVLRSLPEEVRTVAFFTCWTRKEAFIKARGKGMAIPLDAFEVSLDPGDRAAVIATLDDPDEAGRWSLHELHPGPGYAGALAVSGTRCRLKYGEWPFA